MGNCYKTSNNEPTDDRIFDRKVTIDVKCPRYTEKLSFCLGPPERVDIKAFSLRNMDLTLSGCVIPGQDPRGEIEKVCQDIYFSSEAHETLLMGVFDGHGKHGREIVNFCVTFMTNYFHQNNFTNNTKDLLISMVEECDKDLLATSKIDCSTSGTTAVIVLINDKEIWACSVGDSRAILAAIPKYQKVMENININTVSKYKKPIIPNRALKSIPLTLDQKPNISYELERIIKSGGIVQQLSNSEGVKIGPYRVWKPSGKIPGLAMSRSLGDSIAKSIGVISKPIVYNLPMCYARDQYIILGSDGIWDVLDNKEVANFVEKYHSLCARSQTLQKRSSNASNCIIAEFLCEEARHRWLGVCSDEDVAIDDISALVLEIKPKSSVTIPFLKRKGISTEQSLEHITDGPAISMNERFDMKRGSNAVINEVENEDDEEDKSDE